MDAHAVGKLHDFLFESGVGFVDTESGRPGSVGCDGTHRLTRSWAERTGRDPDEVLAAVKARGGCCCDCEVLANVEPDCRGRSGGPGSTSGGTVMDTETFTLAQIEGAREICAGAMTEIAMLPSDPDLEPLVSRLTRHFLGGCGIQRASVPTIRAWLENLRLLGAWGEGTARHRLHRIAGEALAQVEGIHSNA